MRNRIVGLLIIGIALLVGFIVYIFNRALTDIVNTTCTHGPTCSMWTTIDFQTKIGMGIMVFIILVGLYMVFFGKEEKIITRVKKVKEQIKPKKVTRENYKKVLGKLKGDEKKVFEKVIDSQGSIFQSKLVDEIGMTKVKVTRILDRLEGKGLVERKRRGMTNIVLLKHE